MGSASTTGTGLVWEDKSTGGVISGSWTVPISQGAWHHVALCRSDAIIVLCLDGVAYVRPVPGGASRTLGSASYTNYVGYQAVSSYNYDLNGYLDELRITKGIARYLPTLFVPTAAHPSNSTDDPDWSHVTCLLSMDGEDNGTTFTDEVGNTVTPSGNVCTKTGIQVFGTASAYFDGTGDFLTVTSTSGFKFGTGDFTIECWVYLQATGNHRWAYRIGGANGCYLAYNNASGKFNISPTGASSADSITTWSTGRWYHTRVIRTDGVMSLYVDGVLECAIANTTDYTEGSCVVGSGTTAFVGYIDDFRVTKGVARFAAGYTYTVPAAAFPDYGRYVAGSLTESSSHTEFTVRTHRLDTGALLNEITATGASYECPCCPVATARVDYAGPVMVAAWPKLGVPWTAGAVKTVGDYVFPANPVTTPYVYRATVADPVALLMHLDGTDNGTSFPDLCGHTPITRTGEVVTKTATKKVGTASAYFDGTGDTLYFTTGAEFDFGTGDFTIEAWINIDAGSSGPRQIIDKFTVWSSDVDFAFEIGSDGKLAFWAGDGIPIQIRGNAVLNTGQWYHVAVCRASGTTRLFVDGVTQAATHTGSVTIPNGRTTLTIGSNGFAANYWKGYLDEIRVTKAALYTADFTPPTTAFAYGTGSSEPAWPTTPGATVVDGAVTWTCVDRMLQPVLHGPLIPSL